MAYEHDELRHRRSEAAPEICLVNVHRCGQRRPAVRQHLGGRRLVRYERPDLIGMAGHEGEGVHGSAAAGKQINRSRAQRGDQPVEIVRVLIGRRLSGVVGPLAALDSAGVIRHDRSVGEMTGEGTESCSAHRRPDHQQHRRAACGIAPDVIGQHSARHVKGVSLRFGHDVTPVVLIIVLSTPRGGKTHRPVAIRPPTAGPATRNAATDDAGVGGIGATARPDERRSCDDPHSGSRYVNVTTA